MRGCNVPSHKGLASSAHGGALKLPLSISRHNATSFHFDKNFDERFAIIGSALRRMGRPRGWSLGVSLAVDKNLQDLASLLLRKLHRCLTRNMGATGMRPAGMTMLLGWTMGNLRWPMEEERYIGCAGFPYNCEELLMVNDSYCSLTYTNQIWLGIEGINFHDGLSSPQ